MSVRPDLFRRLREGTEVLRTGGGANLYAGECDAVLNLIEAALAFLRADDGAGKAEDWHAANDRLREAVAVFVSGQEEAT